MAKWTDGDVARLKELAEAGLTQPEAAKIMDRSVSAVSSKASDLKVAFDGSKLDPARRLIGRGGVLLREEIEGIGPRWTTAHRAGEAYPTAGLDALLKLGFLKPAAFGSGLYTAGPRWT